MLKRCSKCKEEKDVDSFGKDSSKYDGLFIWCKSCRKEHTENSKNKRKEYWETKKDFFSEKHKEYYQKHKQEICKKANEYYLANKPEIKVKSRIYRKINRLKITSSKKKWSESDAGKLSHNKSSAKYIKNNPDKIKEIRNKSKKTRLNNDFSFKFKEYFSNIFRSYLKKKLLNKGGKRTFSILSYSISDLKYHIEKQFEPWMNWDNQGIYNKLLWDDNDPYTWKWQLDHIIPHSKFSYSSFDDEAFKKCWSLDNLRPLSAKQNWLDKDRK